MANYPILYKKTSTGKIQQWNIMSQGAEIITVFGQVAGKLQEARDTVKSGKNIGKANETTAEQQADLEAKSQWEKKKKKGYVENIQMAENGEVDALIEGGIEPMFALTFDKHGSKIKYPCMSQPKLDGVRCIAIIVNGKASLWSRKRRRITGAPHIIKELESLYPSETITLDGELYSRQLTFEQTVSIVKQENPQEGHEILEYNVFDVAGEGPFIERLSKIRTNDKIRLVKTDITNEEDVIPFFEDARKEGYEGLMLRNTNSPYENKRSFNLIKVKAFLDDEFKIIGISEGRGKLQGHAATFICQMENGATFDVKLKGSNELLKHYFENQDSCIGKMLTVKYQELTGKNGVPRFPVGVAVRDYE